MTRSSGEQLSVCGVEMLRSATHMGKKFMRPVYGNILGGHPAFLDIESAPLFSGSTQSTGKVIRCPVLGGFSPDGNALHIHQSRAEESAH
jgi:hypothetical protein